MADKIELDQGLICVNGQAVARVNPNAPISLMNALEDFMENATPSNKRVLAADLKAKVYKELATRLAHNAGLVTSEEIDDAFEEAVKDL